MFGSPWSVPFVRRRSVPVSLMDHLVKTLFTCVNKKAKQINDPFRGRKNSVTDLHFFKMATILRQALRIQPLRLAWYLFSCTFLVIVL